MSESLANLVKSGDILYSDSEHIIGKVSINGSVKTLYSKTITGNTPNADVTEVAHNITGLNPANIINVKSGVLNAGGNFVPNGFITGGMYWCTIVTSTGIDFRQSNNFYQRPFTVTIEYTKS